MRNKVYWGLGVLIVLILGVFVHVVVNEHAINKHLEAELKEAKELANQVEERMAAENNPPVAREGFKMVQHDDHWHEVPIDAPDTWQGEQHETPVAQPPKAYTGPLTFHKDLLERHPVEALRQQARQVGHWSADHIPPFPPDDTEAAEFARELYLYRYYKWTGQTDNPAFRRHLKAQGKIADALNDWYRSEENKTPWDLARNQDLWKLVWPDTTGKSYIGTRFRTTFTEGINPLTARPLLPFELEWSNRGTTENR